MAVLEHTKQLKKNWGDDLDDFIMDDERCEGVREEVKELIKKIEASDMRIKEELIAILYFMWYAKEQGYDEVKENPLRDGAFHASITLALKENVDSGDMFAFKKNGLWTFTLTEKGNRSAKGMVGI